LKTLMFLSRDGSLGSMVQTLFCLLASLGSSFRDQRELALENLAMRQQLAILKRTHSHPQLSNTDRLFWVSLSRLWQGWKDSLIIVKPDTVVRWHRKGFALYWKRLSRQKRSGRPGTGKEIRDLIRKIAKANPLWGSPRVHGELLKLGIHISERTVARLMPRSTKPPSQTWRTFLDNHLLELVSIDFLVVPTATFRILFVLIVLAHNRRRVVHFNVTEHPTAAWTGEQLIQAFPDGTEPQYLLRDRDRIYGEVFRERVRVMGIEEVLTAPRSPWQNPFAERLNGTIRRDCLNHVIVLGESHLRRTLARYFRYYHKYRTHLSLAKDSPETRTVQDADFGPVVEISEVGGLHHHYERRVA
jgi:putative transposase